MIKLLSLRKLRSPFFFKPSSSLSPDNSFQAQLWHIWLAHSMHCLKSCSLLLWGKGKCLLLLRESSRSWPKSWPNTSSHFWVCFFTSNCSRSSFLAWALAKWVNPLQESHSLQLLLKIQIPSNFVNAKRKALVLETPRQKKKSESVLREGNFVITRQTIVCFATLNSKCSFRQSAAQKHCAAEEDLCHRDAAQSHQSLYSLLSDVSDNGRS